MVHKIILIMSFTVLLSCKDNKVQLNDSEIKKTGVWNTLDYNDDLTFKVITVYENNKFSMRITLNQMDLKGKLRKTNKPNVYEVIYEEADIGRGPTYLGWREFEKDSAVAIFKVIDSTHANIKWLGFYNKKTKLREWDSDMDYQGELIKE